MSLTGIPLIAGTALVTAAALAATVLGWDRWRPRFLLRSLGVLLTEALLVLSAGLVVNRSQEFYPTWAALLQSSAATATTYAVRAGGLDGSLHDNDGDAFPWQPTGLTGWRLAGAPMVVTPAGYLTHPA